MQMKFRSPGFDFSQADRALIAGAPNVTANRRRPTNLSEYYGWVYSQLTKNQPGRGAGHIHNIVVDGGFGVDAERHTTIADSDLVTELSYQRDGQKPAPTGRPEPTPPDSVEGGSSLNLVVQQVLAQGTRPVDPTGSPKAMYFVKLASIAASDPVKTWQTLHATAMESNRAFGSTLQGHELLQRLPDTASEQMINCRGQVPVPELVACFWSKTTGGAAAFQKAFENYVVAFRQADKENAVDHASSFFVLIEEFHYTS